MIAIKYLSDIISRQDLVMMSDIIFVVFPVLSITVLMFSLRSIFQDSCTPKMKKQ